MALCNFSIFACSKRSWVFCSIRVNL